MSIDVKLNYVANKNYYDISFYQGDFEVVDSFDTSLIVSLFSDARADATEVPRPEQRRGWWGDTVDEFGIKIGSKDWLLSQARLTPLILSKKKTYQAMAINWLISNNYSQKINVTAQIVGDGISYAIEIINANSATQSQWYKYWQQTGNFLDGR